MRLYHFTSATHALDDIKNRRLKIANIENLNDPFELLSQDLSNPLWRQRFLETKRQASANMGYLCFSRGWRNPVMWSHYADRHRGVCLGFDVADDACQPLLYSNVRSRLIETCFAKDIDPSPEQVIEWLQTKGDDWSYEDEVRVVCLLKDALIDTGKDVRYFSPFSNQLCLKEVIMGVACSVSIEPLKQYLAQTAPDVEVIQAVLADASFQIARAHSGSSADSTL